jgi:hypothetical protein
LVNYAGIGGLINDVKSRLRVLFVHATLALTRATIADVDQGNCLLQLQILKQQKAARGFCVVMNAYGKWALRLYFQSPQYTLESRVKLRSEAGCSPKVGCNTSADLCADIGLVRIPAVEKVVVDRNGDQDFAAAFACFSNEHLFDLI